LRFSQKIWQSTKINFSHFFLHYIALIENFCNNSIYVNKYTRYTFQQSFWYDNIFNIKNCTDLNSAISLLLSKNLILNLSLIQYLCLNDSHTRNWSYKIIQSFSCLKFIPSIWIRQLFLLLHYFDFGIEIYFAICETIFYLYDCLMAACVTILRGFEYVLQTIWSCFLLKQDDKMFETLFSMFVWENFRSRYLFGKSLIYESMRLEGRTLLSFLSNSNKLRNFLTYFRPSMLLNILQVK